MDSDLPDLLQRDDSSDDESEEGETHQKYEALLNKKLVDGAVAHLAEEKRKNNGRIPHKALKILVNKLNKRGISVTKGSVKKKVARYSLKKVEMKIIVYLIVLL